MPLGFGLVALGALLYARTLRLGWAYDDMDYLNLAADVMAGKRGFWRVVFWPHHEHLVPVLRLIIHGSLRLFGITATPYRLLVFACHLGSGWFLALAARRCSPTAGTAAGVAAGLAYVAPAGFSSMWVWFPTAGCVTIGIFGLTGALAALTYRRELGVRRARLLAMAGVLFGLASESTLAPLVVSLILLDEYERRSEPEMAAGERRRLALGPFAWACLAAMAVVTIAATVLFRLTWGEHAPLSLRYGIPRALFLLLVSPFRYFLPGVSFLLAGNPGRDRAIMGTFFGVAIAAPILALFLALWQRSIPRLARIAALTAVGPLGVLFLVGIGRWRSSFLELYDADRYFFFLLIPIALLAGAVAADAGPRLRAMPRRTRRAILLLVAAAFVAELGIHRRALLDRVPFPVYYAHGLRFRQLTELAERLSAAARALPAGAPPLSVPDGSFLFSDVHNGRISTRLLLTVLARHPDPRLRLGGVRVGERDAAVLNPVLADWGRSLGETLPYVVVEEGRLVNSRMTSTADFETGPHPEAVVSGFYDWEGSSRWMDRSGELRLTMTSPQLLFRLSAPMSLLRGVDSSWDAIHVHVTGTDEATGWTTDLGDLRLAEDGWHTYRLDASRLLARKGAGVFIRIVLTADRTWRPVDVLPRTIDWRRISVRVARAGFEGSL